MSTLDETERRNAKQTCRYCRFFGSVGDYDKRGFKDECHLNPPDHKGRHARVNYDTPSCVSFKFNSL